MRRRSGSSAASVLLLSLVVQAIPAPAQSNLCIQPGLFHSLTEPPCSYCSTQNRKGLIQNEDTVIALDSGSAQWRRSSAPPFSRRSAGDQRYLRSFLL